MNLSLRTMNTPEAFCEPNSQPARYLQPPYKRLCSATHNH
jgi:hypothetical protein